MNFRSFFNESQEEIWQQTKSQYLAVYKAKVDDVDARYDAVYNKYVSPTEYPVHGDFWTRYGHSIDVSGGLSRFTQEQSKLIKE